MPSTRVPLPLVRLQASAEREHPAKTVTGQIQLAITGQPVNLEVTIPVGNTRIDNLMPIFQGMAEVVVNIAAQKSVSQGKPVTCRKGCGACCRQLVPVSAMEARHLAALVEAMPEPRRSGIKQRFEQARQRLLDADLDSQVKEGSGLNKELLRSLGLAYLSLGIACPFLEEESCSIHPDRPLACREYLVTSPAEACSKPTAETISMVPISAHVTSAARLLEQQVNDDPVQLMPLIIALQWSAMNSKEPAAQPAEAMLQVFFRHLAGAPADTAK